MELLTVNNLSYEINDNKILDNINFTVNQGDYINIIGPNGAGKTTLLKILNGLLSKYNGIIKLKKINISDYSNKQLSKTISFVPQHSVVKNYYSFTVFEYMLTGRFPYINRLTGYTAEDKDIVNEIIEKLKMRQLLNRKLDSLSGGELQKVILGTVLAQQTDIILFDEATTFLDIHHKLEFYHYLDMLVQNGETVISVTHNLNDIVNTTGKVLAVKKGRQYFFGLMENFIKSNSIEEVFNVKFKKIIDTDSKIFHLVPVELKK